MSTSRFLNFLIAASTILMTGISCDNGIEEWEGQKNNNGKIPVTEPINWRSRAEQTYNSIILNYQITTGAAKGLFNENSPKGAYDGIASFLWPYDGLVAGVAVMNELGFDVNYVNMVDKFQVYYRTSGDKPVGGFGSSTNGVTGGGSRFYDDNAIIGLELVEAYRQTGDTKYLDWCAQIIRFYKAGIDDIMGRALWWCESNINQPENDSSNKPACANGFATWFLLKYYEVCPAAEKEDVLNLAKDLYTWLYNNLRDTEDNTYWNSKGADQIINRTKWTYNSGAMIAAGHRLYKILGDNTYLNHAKATADGAYNYFVRSRNGLPLCYPTNDPWFTIQLIKSYIELEESYAKCKTYIDVFVNYLDYAWEHGRMSNGLFYEDWTGKNINPSRDGQLLMQAAALESLAVIALYTEENK